jgi:hypothetical protein
MPSDIALQISSQYQDSGLKQATASMQGFQNSVQAASEGSGRSMDGLFKRLERPIGMIAFQGIANDLVGLGKNGESAGMMVERGLHAAGVALMYFNAPLGISIIAVTAFYEVMMKMKGASEETAESIKKQTTELTNHAMAASGTAETLKQLGVISKETYDALMSDSAKSNADAMDKIKQVSKETDTAIKKTKASLAEMLKEQNSIVAGSEKMDSATQAYIHTSLGAINSDGQRAQKIKDLKDQLDKLIATQEAANSILDQKKTPKDNKKDNAWMDDVIQAQERVSVSTMKLSDIKKQLAANDKKMGIDEIAMSNASTKEQADDIKKKIDGLTKYDDILKKHAIELDKDTKKEDESYKKIGAAVESMMNTQVSALVSGKSTMKQVLASMAADAIKITADMATTQLKILAAKDLASPLTFGIGLAEMAAIGAINGIAGGLGAAITESGSPTPSSTGATGQNNVTTPSASGQQGNQTQLQVIVQGGVIDDAFAANLAKRLSDVVQFNNVQLVASNGVSYS